ncbi:MAG: GNAT family N-acetyltransferase [Cyanobacteria bacterium J06623_4]
MSKQVSIRYAQLKDLIALRDLCIKSFCSAFATDNNVLDMDAYVSESFSEARIRAEFLDARNTFLLLFSADSVLPLGYAKLRAGEVDPSVSGEDPIEIERLYLENSAIGKGLGTKLMSACLVEAEKQGAQTVWLGVWEHNERAITFYERWDFKRVGSHVFMLGSDEQNDFIMQRPLKKKR